MGRCSAHTLLFIVVMVSGSADQTVDIVNGGTHQVAVVVGQVVEQYLAGCHLVLVTTSQHSLLLQGINRQLSSHMGSVVAEAVTLFSQHQPVLNHLLHGLWGEARHTCRALILHLTDDSLAFRFFEASKLWFWPEIRTVIIGVRTDMESFLHHPSLRNTKHILYLALNLRKNLRTNRRLKQGNSAEGLREEVKVYRRCLYCGNGGMDVQLLFQWNLISISEQTHDLFPDWPEDFMGHRFRIVALPFFPVSDFRRNSQAPGTTMTPVDSIDVRMLNTIAAHANFTYEVREPCDGQWGVDHGDGNWTGTVGTLQQHRADFSLVLTPTPARIRVVQFSSLYIRESVVIFSLKPETLPQNLAFIRPLTGVIWLMLFASILLWSVALWLLQKAWSRISGSRDLGLSSAFLYGWGVLMEKWTFHSPANYSGRLLVGFWLMTCMILTIAYRSSLVAHLVIQDKMPEINTFQDLLAREGWAWGVSYISGSLYTFLETHPNSDFQKIKEHMQYAPAEEQFQRVLEGRYSYITYKYGGVARVAAHYTNSRGYTPIRVSKTEYVQYAGEGWAFRRGAPFRLRFSGMIQHLLEGGFTDYWLKDVLASHMRKGKAQTENKEEKEKRDYEYTEVEDGQVVLGLNHLQGAFYLLLLGCGLAILTLVGENLTHYLGRILRPHMQDP